MKPSTKSQKEIALGLLKQLDIFEPYIQDFKDNNHVYFFERYIGFQIDKESEIYKKMNEIESKYGCIVYAATHEFTVYGEFYSYLIVPRYRGDWNHLIKNYGNKHGILAYVWNKDDDTCSEFGRIMICSFGGGITRIA